jgi:hypothetical protein
MICQMCNEEILDGERNHPVNGGFDAAHDECLLRSVMGGIGHLTDHEFWCRTIGDPDASLTYRASALAVAAWIEEHGVPT